MPCFYHSRESSRCGFAAGLISALPDAATSPRDDLRAMARPLHVMIAGGGVAALETVLALRDLAEERVDVEVLAPDEDFVYRAMSVAEPFAQGEARRFPLARLVDLAGGRLTTGTLTRVDAPAQTCWTADGEELTWDVLVVALGARTREGVPGSLTFRGPADTATTQALVDDASAGRIQSLTFAVPTLVAWPLPLYELALMTKVHLEDFGATNVEIRLVTPEDEPLGVFGREVSAEIKDLLATRGIELRTHTTPVVFRSGALVVVPGRAVRTDRVVSLPIPEGRWIPGLPTDGHGFIRTDSHGRAEGHDRIYAAGDITSFPLKQGGIAAQQADAVAASIAALAGAPVAREPFRPELRGLLLTGLSPRYLSAKLLDARSEVDTEPLWWPPAKVFGRYLAPFLAEHAGLSQSVPAR